VDAPWFSNSSTQWSCATPTRRQRSATLSMRTRAERLIAHRIQARHWQAQFAIAVSSSGASVYSPSGYMAGRSTATRWNDTPPTSRVARRARWLASTVKSNVAPGRRRCCSASCGKVASLSSRAGVRSVVPPRAHRQSTRCVLVRFGCCLNVNSRNRFAANRSSPSRTAKANSFHSLRRPA